MNAVGFGLTDKAGWCDKGSKIMFLVSISDFLYKSLSLTAIPSWVLYTVGLSLSLTAIPRWVLHCWADVFDHINQSDLLPLYPVLICSSHYKCFSSIGSFSCSVNVKAVSCIN